MMKVDNINQVTLIDEVEAARVAAHQAFARLMAVKRYNKMLETATEPGWEPVDELVEAFLEERVRQLADDWRNVAELVALLGKEVQ